MSATHPAELQRMLGIASDLAHVAGEPLVTARASDVRSKSNPRDLVTEWDLRTETTLREGFARLTPSIPMMGEETGGADARAGLRWVVDPIDGTVNFAHGLPIWAISIALEEDGEAIVGIVHAPALGWTFSAVHGGGAFCTGYPGDVGDGRMAVSAVAPLDRAMLCTGFPYDYATHPDNNAAQWAHLLRVAGTVRRLGSASLDLCLVARGVLDGYWETRLQRWDLAAGALIVREAGGTVTNTAGATFDAERGDVAATNGAIHEALIHELATVAARTTA